MDLSLEGIEIVNLRHPDESDRAEHYARILAGKNVHANDLPTKKPTTLMFRTRTSSGMMMVETGDATHSSGFIQDIRQYGSKWAKRSDRHQPGLNTSVPVHYPELQERYLLLADTLI